MKITIIGSGYVGIVSGACFAEFGFEVTCVDKAVEKIDSLRQGKVPIYEPGLDLLIEKNTAAGRLHFTTELAESVAAADAVFIAVGTPTRRGDGHADLSYVYAAAGEIAHHIKGYTVIVTKSTVPVGTGREVQSIISRENPDADFDVVSNPEFLREGSAIGDFMRPDRVVVGAESERAAEVMRTLYRPLFLRETPIVFTTIETSEMIKYAANAFLAVKISYINQMADLAEAIGADIHDIAHGIGLDNRIGQKFLHPGPGYGGSCFPKDTLALCKTAELKGVDISIVSDVVTYNEQRKQKMADKVISANGGAVAGKKIAVLGLAFKPETDDMRDSPALALIPPLIEAGAEVTAYDPAAMEQAKPMLPQQLNYAKSTMECLEGADCMVILTEWNEFRSLAPDTVRAAMTGRVIVDLRNIFSRGEFQTADAGGDGFHYSNIGCAGIAKLKE